MRSEEEIKEEIKKKVLMAFAGEMMKVRMGFELEAGDGTGKDEMRIEDYKLLINKFGDIIKNL